MAWGTESCPRVDKLFGPGNQFVTAAKMYLQNSEAMVSIDMPAGPSEVLVIADGGAHADHVACDLLSQAEHGPDSQAVLVALPSFDVPSLELALDLQLSTLPRAEMTKKSLSNSKIVLVDNKDQALEFSNCYAPEHLIINTEDADDYVDGISNAGSVFLGRYTPESVGDYASGKQRVHSFALYKGWCICRYKSCFANIWLCQNVQWCLIGLILEEDHCPEIESIRS